MKDKKHLIILYQECMNSGGVEIVVKNLAHEFYNMGHNVYMIYHNNDKINDYHKGIKVIKLPLIKMSFIRNITYKKYANIINNVISDIENKENSKISLLLSNKKIPNQIIKRTKLKNKSYCYSIVHVLYNNKTGLSEIRARNRYKSLYKDCNIIAVSNGIKQDIQNKVNIKFKSINTIYNPFDINQIILKSKEKNIIAEDNYILYAGRIAHEKNINRLINAYKISNISAKLVILVAGFNNDISELRTLIINNKLESQIIFLSFQANPYPIMKNAKLLVLSSDFEPFGNVIVESLICGTPVASTNCPHGPKEILKNEMSNGLCDLSADSLAKKINEIYHNPYKIDNKFIEENFSIKHICKKYLSLIEN